MGSLSLRHDEPDENVPNIILKASMRKGNVTCKKFK